MPTAEPAAPPGLAETDVAEGVRGRGLDLLIRMVEAFQDHRLQVRMFAQVPKKQNQN